MNSYLEVAIRDEVRKILHYSEAKIREEKWATAEQKKSPNYYYFPKLQKILRKISEICGYSVQRSSWDSYDLKIQINGAKLFEQYCKEFGVPETIKRFKSINIASMMLRGSFFPYFFAPDRPFYTKAEWLETIEGFIHYLQKNEGPIISTGYPKTTYNANFFLSIMMSNTFPIKIPDSLQGRTIADQLIADDRGTHEVDDDGNLIYKFTWRKQESDMVLEYDEGSHCSYEEAFILKSLDEIHPSMIEQMRKKMIDAKIWILNQIKLFITEERSFFHGDHFFKDAMNGLFKHFTKNELDFAVHFDKIYHDFFTIKKMNPNGVFIKPTQIFRFGTNVNGGLSDIITMLSYFDKEFRHYKFFIQKKSINEAVKLHVHGLRETLSISGDRINDLEILQGYVYRSLDNVRVRQVVDYFLHSIMPTDQEDEIINDQRKIYSDILSQYHVWIDESMLFEGIHKDYFRSCILKYGFDIYKLKEFFARPNKLWFSNDNAVSDWGQITIKFQKEHHVEITEKLPSGDRVGVYDYRELGFVDKRKNKPDRSWEFLRYLSKNEGKITQNDQPYEFSFYSKPHSPWPIFTKRSRYLLLTKLENIFGVSREKKLFEPLEKVEGKSTNKFTTAWSIGINLIP